MRGTLFMFRWIESSLVLISKEAAQGKPCAASFNELGKGNLHHHLIKNSGLPVCVMRERVNRYTWNFQYNLDCPQLLWYSSNEEIFPVPTFGSMLVWARVNSN